MISLSKYLVLNRNLLGGIEREEGAESLTMFEKIFQARFSI